MFCCSSSQENRSGKIAYYPFPRLSRVFRDEMRRRAAEFRTEVQRRRTVREFSSRPVPREVIEDCLRAAGTAPNGANLQPWYFVVVSAAAMKREIRIAAEKEELESYLHKAPRNGWTHWLRLAPMCTNRFWSRRRI
jgi:nitroreductase